MEEILQDGLERRDTGAAAGHTWEEDGKTSTMLFSVILSRQSHKSSGQP